LIDESKLDKIERKIYQFVLKNKDCNENDVRNSKVCSQRWAKIKLWRLVERGIIEDRRIGKSFHKFRVSDRTLFDRINKQLYFIETQIIIFERPLLNIAELQDKGGVNRLAASAFAQKFVFPFRDSMFTMLFELLKLSDTDDVGKEDSLILHTKILLLIAKVTREPYYSLNHKEILARNKNLLNHFIQELSEPGTDSAGFRVESLKTLVKNLDKFEEQFG
jgi:hypothetical protein